MGVMTGMPAKRISRGEDATEDALDWVSWSSSESDCMAVSNIPEVVSMLWVWLWLGGGIVMLMVGIGFELTVSM